MKVQRRRAKAGRVWADPCKWESVALYADIVVGNPFASPGRCPEAARRYLETRAWREVIRLFRQFSQQHGTEELLVNLALG